MPIDGRARPLKHQIVDQRIARPGVAGDRLSRIGDEGEIADPANIQQRDLILHSADRNERAMKSRNDRGALPTGRNIGGAEIIGDVNAQTRRERRAVADLHCEALFGPMQDGLTMEANQIDRTRLHPMIPQKALYRFGMTVRHHLLGKSQHARSRVAIMQGRSLAQRIPQQRPIDVVIGKMAGRAESDGGFAIGLDTGDVNAVH